MIPLQEYDYAINELSILFYFGKRWCCRRGYRSKECQQQHMYRKRPQIREIPEHKHPQKIKTWGHHLGINFPVLTRAPESNGSENKKI
jgi:hypothetical protein